MNSVPLVSKINLNKIVIAMGSTGTGKSTIINMLFNNGFHKTDCEQPCLIGASADSVTKTTKWFFSDNGNVYGDTIGFGDPNLPDYTIAKELNEFLRRFKGGVHCIIIVAKYGRLSREERINLNAIRKLFDDRWAKCCVMVLTNYGGNMDTSSQKNALEKWLGDDKEVQEFVTSINNNVILTDNNLERLEVGNREIRKNCLDKLNQFIATCNVLIGPAPGSIVDVIKLLLEQLFAAFRIANAAKRINNVTVYLYSQMTKSGSDVCAVCLDEMTLNDITYTNCNHTFHMKCILNSLNTNVPFVVQWFCH